LDVYLGITFSLFQKCLLSFAWWTVIFNEKKIINTSLEWNFNIQCNWIWIQNEIECKKNKNKSPRNLSYDLKTKFHQDNKLLCTQNFLFPSFLPSHYMRCASRISELLLFWHIHHIHFTSRNNLVFLFLCNQREYCFPVNHLITECGETLQDIPGKFLLIISWDLILLENMYFFSKLLSDV
jgi:hypothetical protein